MSDSMHSPTVSRRIALASLGMGGLALTVGGSSAAATGRQDADALASHPIVGAWLVVTVGGPAPGYFLPDGTFLYASAPISADADGVITFLSPQTGVWEAEGERGAHFTSVQSIHDAAGIYLGTLTIDGHPVVSADGETIYDDGTQVRLTFRDPDGEVTMVIGEDEPLPPVYGTRMRPGIPNFMHGPPDAATPAD